MPENKIIYSVMPTAVYNCLQINQRFKPLNAKMLFRVKEKKTYFLTNPLLKICSNIVSCMK